MLGATSWDKSVRVWGVETQIDQASGLATAVNGTPLGVQNSDMPILTCDFAKDGRCFYAGCDRAAMMWDLQSGALQQVGAHDNVICCARYAEDGAAAPMLVTSGWDGKVRFWDLRSDQPAKEESFGAPVHHMDLSTAPLATFMCGRKIHVYDLSSLTKVNELEPVAKASYAMRRVANVKDQSGVVACTVDGRVVTFPLDDPANWGQFKAHGGADRQDPKVFDAYQVNFISMHPTNKTVITGASDGLIRCFDLPAQGRFYEWKPRLFNNAPVPVSAGDLSADGLLLAYSLSYDWSLGKDGFNANAPQGVFIKCLTTASVR